MEEAGLVQRAWEGATAEVLMVVHEVSSQPGQSLRLKPLAFSQL